MQGLPSHGWRQLNKLALTSRLTTLNVGTVPGRYNELPKAIETIRIDNCAVQKTRWRGSKSAYAPQTGQATSVKDAFWRMLCANTAKVPLEDYITIAGDLNGHIGCRKEEQTAHGGHGFGEKNDESQLILDFSEAHNLAIASTCCDTTLSIDLQATNKVSNKQAHRSHRTFEESWEKLEESAHKAAHAVLVTTRPGRRRIDRDTWIWNDTIKDAVHTKK
ncbi:uncharacterized protein LOC126199655 [Schistocerca nitens]|uniref:uncharacterized protein LOC126199655 n=1 Tax=Schistocerca nitens TaxID=7011 RepID=UPI0021185EDF|nr:uncharacterized protein LOC126199655 [Schistocerca nitens]